MDKYTRLVLWDSRDDWRVALLAPALVSFLNDNPAEGIFTETGIGLGYEVVFEIDGPGYAGVVNLNDFIVDVDGAVPAFIESRRVYWEGAKEGDPRFVRRLLLRARGGPQVPSRFTPSSLGRAGRLVEASRQKQLHDPAIHR